MGVHEGRGALGKGIKELLQKWQETRMTWDDEVAKGFEKQRLELFETDLKAAISAMDTMTVLLRQIRRDCE